MAQAEHEPTASAPEAHHDLHKLLDRRTIIAGLAGALPAAAIGGTPALASPDAELIALGEKLRFAWAAQNDLGEDAVFEPAGQVASAASAAIVDEIGKVTATTLDGMRVKALAVSWCHSGDAFDDGSFGGDCTTDMRIISSLLNDLLAIGGGGLPPPAA